MSLTDAGTDAWVGSDLVDRHHHKLGMTPYDSREIEGAPRLGSADGLPTDQVQVLYDHYALGYDGPDQAPRATTVERVLMYLR